MDYCVLQNNLDYKPNITQRLITLFVFLTALCVPFATVDIAGFGVLLIITIPLFFLTIISKIRKGSIIISKPSIYLFFFILYSIVSCAWSPSFSTYFMYQFAKTALLIICLYANAFSIKEQKTIIIGASLSCLLICFFMLSGSSAIEYVEGRATISVFGASQDPNYIAYAFFFAFAIFLDGLFAKKRIIRKIICAICLIVILYCALLTGSRGSWISITAIVIVYSFSKYGRNWKTFLLTAILIIAVIYIYPLILQLLPNDLARRFTYEHLMHNNGSNRLEIWKTTINILKESPLQVIFGFGTGSSVSVVGRATHNYFLQLLLEEGIIGLILFISFSVYWIKNLIKQHSTISLCVFVACIVMSFTLSVNTSYYFWVTFILSILCRNLNSTNSFWGQDS